MIYPTTRFDIRLSTLDDLVGFIGFTGGYSNRWLWGNHENPVVRIIGTLTVDGFRVPFPQTMRETRIGARNPIGN